MLTDRNFGKHTAYSRYASQEGVALQKGVSEIYQGGGIFIKDVTDASFSYY